MSSPDAPMAPAAPSSPMAPDTPSATDSSNAPTAPSSQSSPSSQSARIAPVAIDAEVIERLPVGAATSLLRLAAPELKTLGRFARLRAWAGPPYGGGPLLDRPFSIFRSGPEGAAFLVRNVGPGTRILTSLAPGAVVGLLGPLGRGLDDLKPDFRESPWHLVAGGVGLAALGSIAADLGPKARLYYGERSTSALMDIPALLPGIEFELITEEGPGPRGFVTDLLAGALKTDPRPVLACGPAPMLAAVQNLCQKEGVPAYACVEARMACGLGACLSCVVPLKSGGSLRACREGPVLDAGIVDWEAIR